MFRFDNKFTLKLKYHETAEISICVSEHLQVLKHQARKLWENPICRHVFG